MHNGSFFRKESMINFLFSAPAWQLVAQADIMTKFVLFSLFLLSVFCVWVILSKFFALHREKKLLQQLQVDMKGARTFDDLLELSKTYQNSSAGRFLIRVLAELKELLHTQKRITGVEQEGEKICLTIQDVEHLQLLVDQSLDHIISQEEQYLPVLGTSAAVAPLIGLFGTVWGLVHAFVDISQQRSADISVVAPGIAEALTTTLAGLIVAIPALIFFHYFSNELRKLELKLLSVSDRFLNIIKQTFVKIERTLV